MLQDQNAQLQAALEGDRYRAEQASLQLQEAQHPIVELQLQLEQVGRGASDEAEVDLLRSKVADLEAQLEAAVEEAAAKERDLNELMACLGQEGAKVEKLGEVLGGFGVDVDGLLERERNRRVG